MIIIFNEEIERIVDDNTLLKIPYFEALFRSSMEEVNENKVQIDIDVDIFDKFIMVLDYNKYMNKLSKSEINNGINNFFISHVTARLTLNQVKQYYNTQFSINKPKYIDILKKIMIKLTIEHYEKLLGDSLNDIQELADRWCCSDIVNFCNAIKKKKQKDIHNMFKFLYGTCAHYFGSSYGCKYGKKCIYQHTCKVEDRLRIIEESKTYLMNKRLNRKNNYNIF